MDESLTADWTGGVSNFATDPGAVSQVSVQPSAAAPNWWQLLLAQFGATYGVPALPDVASATGSGVAAVGSDIASGARAVANALPSPKAFGIWLLVIVGLLVVGLVAWKV